MKKELKKRVWEILPKEYKEEVLRFYNSVCEELKDEDESMPFYLAKNDKNTLKWLFGEDNLIQS